MRQVTRLVDQFAYNLVYTSIPTNASGIVKMLGSVNVTRELPLVLAGSYIYDGTVESLKLAGYRVSGMVRGVVWLACLLCGTF